MSDLSGPLTLPRCAELLARAEALLAHGGGDAVIDLSHTAAADSAGVSLLLELQRRARARGLRLRFRRAPAQLRALAAFFGVAPLLAFDA